MELSSLYQIVLHWINTQASSFLVLKSSTFATGKGAILNKNKDKNIHK